MILDRFCAIARRIDRRRRADAILLAVALAALAALATALSLGLLGEGPPPQRRPVPARTAAPPIPLPAVEPLELKEIPVETARATNAAVPFSTAPVVAAAPFASKLAGVDRERALDCLAAAAWYEAGNSPRGQDAVMQVVLNRVRHPAYPPSVCGVVFQGSERTTGCQFTFTCDGALARYRPSADAWKHARARAESALATSVFAAVGTATHYHTDWVVPYWSASLDKIVAIETHLFFRWRGYWGLKSAFSQRPLTVEPAYAKLAFLSPVHATPDAIGTATVPLTAPLVVDEAIAAPPVPLLPTGAPALPAMERIDLERDVPSGRHALAAVARCGDRPMCRLLGWADPAAAPAVIDRASIAQSPPDFVYIQSLRDRAQRAWWNCARFPREEREQCLPPAPAIPDLVYAITVTPNSR